MNTSVRRKPSTQRSVKRECAFCAIQNDPGNAFRVWEDEDTFVFLDHRPLFPGHCLLIAKRHAATLTDLDAALLHAVFDNVRVVAMAVQNAMHAEGTFIAVNNIVSQSVPHFHVHVVPRRKGDGLRGFFWPRQEYESDAQVAAVANAIGREILRLKSH